MKIITIIISFLILFIRIILSSGFIITNGPQDTTVCMNAMAECDCGFTGTDPNFAVPNWRIVFRSVDGSVISNDTINGLDILNRLINGLQWLPDLTSGDNNSTNSKLLVGPVNMTHNQSSYQCIFAIVSGSVVSSMGTMTVVDPPSVIINVDEICTTSIIISLNTHSHPACGDVSHNVTISDNVVYRDTDGGSNYTIDELQSHTLYNITVTSTYNRGIVYRSVRTSLAKPPYPINVTSIECEKTSNDNVRIMWKPPEIDECSMLAIKCYDVIIYSDDGEIIIASKETDINSVTFPMKDLNGYSNTAFTINVTVTVVDIEGQRSTTSAHTMIINGTRNPNLNDPGVTTNEGPDGNSDDNNAIVIVIPVIILFVLAIIIIVIILLYLRHHHLHKSHDVKSGKKTEDNCYVTQDESKSQDTTLYAVSGPTSAWSDSTQSKSNEVETSYEPSIHNDNIDEDESTPPLPPRLNYAEIQLASEVPKIMEADHHVAYAETKPA